MLFYLRFPRGTVARAATPSANLQRRLNIAMQAGLTILLVEDNVYQIRYVTRSTWRHATSTCRRLFPEAQIFQRL